MIKFYIIGQTIRFATPAIAADSLNYLECEFDFIGEGWEGASKWAHFRQERQGEDIVYDIAIENDLITAEKKLNLTIGQWEVYVTGTLGETRITTVPVILTVYESGLVDAPLHEMPLTVAEQIDAKALMALLMAQAVKDMADSGDFDGKDGKDGKGIEIGDYFDTFERLQNEAPHDDKLYGVGTKPPITFYGWSESTAEWVEVGAIQGIPGQAGEQGKPGATFTPHVSDSGFLSWTNDGGLANPASVNILGPQGPQGEAGADGKGPYEYAQEGGYTGTEATFMAAMTQFPYHHARHEAGGADPITVNSAMLASGAVTRAKLADEVINTQFVRMGTAHDIVPSDKQKKLVDEYANRNVQKVITLSRTLSAALPVGFLVAITSKYSDDIIINVSGVRLGTYGYDSQVATATKPATLKMKRKYGTIVLEKYEEDSSGDLWIATGNLEVL